MRRIPAISMILAILLNTALNGAMPPQAGAAIAILVAGELIAHRIEKA